MAKRFFPYIVIILVGLFIGIPLLQPGIYPTHDSEYHIIRFYEFFQTLKDGNLYPRWAPDLNNGFGVPLFNFVYPLPNYIASLFHFLGFSFIDSFKISMVVALLLSGVLFYLWMREFISKNASIIASLLYISAPYHLLDMVIRGSIGEVWALAFFPGFLWAITHYKKHYNVLYFNFSIVFLSLTIFSHNILALMFFCFTLFYSWWLGYFTNKALLKEWFFIVGMSLFISSIFWLPALVEKQYVTGLEVYDVKTNFLDLSQLLIPSWGSGFFNSDINPMSVQIGLANIVIIFVSLGVSIMQKKYRKYLLFFLAALFATLILMFPISEPIWRTIPLINYFQFPWRLLSLVIILISALGGFVCESMRPRWLGWGLALLSLVLAFGYRTPAHFFNRDDNYYISRDNFIHGTNSPGNFFNTTWYKSKPLAQTKVVSSKDIEVSHLLVKGQHYSFLVHNLIESNLVVNTAYFPGWKAAIDEKEVKTGYNKDGLLTFRVPPGNHAIVVWFGNTPVRLLATIICMISLFFLVLNGVKPLILHEDRN